MLPLSPYFQYIRFLPYHASSENPRPSVILSSCRHRAYRIDYDDDDHASVLRGNMPLLRFSDEIWRITFQNEPA